MNKNILSRLMELNNKKADEFLAKFTVGVENNISKSKDNDGVYKNLELLEEFIYKVPDKALGIIRIIINDKKLNKVKIYRVGNSKFEGKTYEDLVLKSIDLINKIRYLKTQEVLGILMNLYNLQDQRIKSEVIKTLERLAGYDLQVLKKVGYTIQREILDKILSLNKKERIENTEVIKIIAKELLDSSFGGAEMQNYKTMVIHSGALKPTDFLKKIRKDTINLIVYLYWQIVDIKIRISLLQVLNYASQSPHTLYGDDVIAMMTENIKYLVDIYEKIIFDKKDKIIAELPVVQEIEHQLIWFNKNHKDKIPKIALLLNKIRKASFYSFYRILVGDYWDRYEEEKDGEKTDELEPIIKEIRKDNIKNWIGKLNSIASYRDFVDEWKFQLFSNLLIKLAKEKPDLSGIILNDAIVYEKPLKKFIWQFLLGFRQGTYIKLWDEFVEKIIISRDIELLISIVSSINLESARKKDIELLSKIIKRDGPFKFVDKSGEKILLQLNNVLVRTLANLYDIEKKKTKELIIYMIKQEKNEQNLWLYVQALSFPARKEKINFSEWGKENLKVVLNVLVKIKSLDYEAQNILLNIAKKDFSSVMEVFIRRIKERAEITAEKWVSSTIYDAIPYHFENDLRGYLSGNEQYPKIVGKWIGEMTPKSSMYNLELAQLLQRIGGENFREILLQLIKSGEYENLKKAINLLWGLEPSDVGICLEIIKKTDNPKIWASVGGRFFSTGVVSGEYGISEAYESRIKEIERYEAKGTKKEIERVGKFKKKMIKDLRESAKNEKQRADEENKLMESGF